MKRISILTMVLLVLGPSVTKARYYGLARYRTRWSIHTQSLISGDVRYSPYAFKYGHSGLVPGDVRYSPYAFSHKNSGLVTDGWYGPYCYPYTPVGLSCPAADAADCDTQRSCGDSAPDEAQVSYAQKVQARRERIRQLKQARGQANAIRQTDGKQIISNYLKGKNIDFRTNRLLCIDDKTISVDFLLKDRNIIIKYWNPVEILALDQKPEYKRNYYERYLESWKDFGGKHQRSGGKIFQIISANPDEISARLTDHHELISAEKVYALDRTAP
jgi:hypothetical protein